MYLSIQQFTGILRTKIQFTAVWLTLKTNNELSRNRIKQYDIIKLQNRLTMLNPLYDYAKQ